MATREVWMAKLKEAYDKAKAGDPAAKELFGKLQARIKELDASNGYDNAPAGGGEKKPPAVDQGAAIRKDIASQPWYDRLDRGVNDIGTAIINGVTLNAATPAAAAVRTGAKKLGSMVGLSDDTTYSDEYAKQKDYNKKAYSDLEATTPYSSTALRVLPLIAATKGKGLQNLLAEGEGLVARGSVGAVEGGGLSGLSSIFENGDPRQALTDAIHGGMWGGGAAIGGGTLEKIFEGGKKLAGFPTKAELAESAAANAADDALLAKTDPGAPSYPGKAADTKTAARLKDVRLAEAQGPQGFQKLADEKAARTAETVTLNKIAGKKNPVPKNPHYREDEQIARLASGVNPQKVRLQRMASTVGGGEGWGRLPFAIGSAGVLPAASAWLRGTADLLPSVEPTAYNALRTTIRGPAGPGAPIDRGTLAKLLYSGGLGAGLWGSDQ